MVRPPHECGNLTIERVWGPKNLPLDILQERGLIGMYWLDYTVMSVTADVGGQ